MGACRMSRATSTLAATLIALAGLTGQVAAQEDAPVSDAELAAGEALYAENCAACHGADLEGQPDWRSPDPDGLLPAPPHDDTGHSWHHGDGLLFSYTKFGGAAAMEAAGVSGFRSGMPAFEEILDDEEIGSILAFIKSTWPDRIRELQSVRTQAENMRNQ